MSGCGAPYGDYLYARFRNAVPAEMVEEFECLEVRSARGGREAKRVRG